MKNNVVICKILETRIDTRIVPEFKKELLALIVQESPNLIIDLASVTYIDSSGLGALLFGRRQAKRFLGDLVIINPGPKIKKLIEIAHLPRTLVIYDTTEEAIHSFAK